MIVLDTGVCVALIRSNSVVLARRAKSPVPVITTAVTAGELRFGAAKSAWPDRNQEVVTAFLRTLPVINLTQASALRYGELKARLEQRGQRIEDAGLWIAAMTLQIGASLATGNLRHYTRIPELPVEDWLRDLRA